MTKKNRGKRMLLCSNGLKTSKNGNMIMQSGTVKKEMESIDYQTYFWYRFA